MDILFIGLMLWIFGSMIIGEVLPGLVELCFYLVRFVCLCIWHAAKAFFWLLRWAGAHLGRGCAWAFSQAHLFFAILIDEWRSGPQADDDFDDEEDEEEGPQGAYEQAVALLGLSSPFTQDDLKRVYRRAMKTAHTDVGGNKEDAQALNVARDLVMKARGWA